MHIIELTHSDPGILRLIEEHRRYCHEHTPQGSGHAVDASSAMSSSIRYFAALDSAELLGCVGYKALSADRAELKTMHVLPAARGRGVGEALVLRLMQIARDDGVDQLFLETGRSEGFAASRRLYRRLGFDACEPFGAYATDPFSFCMTRRI